MFVVSSICQTISASGASLTANQGVAGSSNFYDHSHPSAGSRRAVVSYWRKNGHEVLVNCLGGLPKNSVARLADRALNDLKRVEGL